MTDWKTGDEFKISGVIALETHCPRVKTTGVILELLHNKKARAVLKNIEGEESIEAVVHLRDLKPLIVKKSKSP